MSGDVADFMFANMSGTSRGRSGSGAFPGSAGAVIKGDVLYLATVKRDDLGRLRLQQEFTRQFRMPGRLQPAVRAFSMEVAKFFKSANIRRVLLRRTPDSRKYPLSPEGYAIECALKLVPQLMVEEAHNATIRAWPREQRHMLPRPPVGRLQASECFQAAIEAAGLLESRR